ncbi:MAG: glycosyl transferase [Chlamydiae bacterium]|nr:MAG: glycosyl transferase [Chlamydiota bacterium]
MTTALVYDWLVESAGGEKALEAIYELYPSPIYTLVHNKKTFTSTCLTKEIHTSFIQKMPFGPSCYRYYLPFFPLAIEQFDLRDYNVVVSLSHAVAKGVLTHPDQLHVCYCFTPMRYAWDLMHCYLERAGVWQRRFARFALHYLRNWDITSLNRVDHFVAISHYIARRIRKLYGREASVIYPPVDVERFCIQEKKEEYFITVSRLVPYKRVDLIVKAFSYLPQHKLLVIGDGPEMKKITQLATKNVEILGYLPDEIMHSYVAKAKAFIFAAEEDFGICVLEAQAAGVPVIAFGKGATLETVIENQTGIFFEEQQVASLLDAIACFEKKEFDPNRIQQHAQKFSRKRFHTEFDAFIDKKTEEKYESHHFSRR